MFITLEGIDGSGKSTQIKLLYDYLKQKTNRVTVTREPGGTRVGESIRSVLINAEYTELEALSELFLLIADRAQHVREFIAPALLGGEIVLCDRFTDSTIAYQGFGRGVEIDLIVQLNAKVIDMCVPDLTVILDCEPRVAFERLRRRAGHDRISSHLGRFEREEKTFHRRVREGYLWVAERDPERVKLVDGHESVEATHQVLVEIIKETFRKNAVKLGEGV